jgi:hypothetical protein
MTNRLQEFEFGREYEFLRTNSATQTKEILQEKSFDKLVLSKEGFTISLLSYAGEERPFRLTIAKGKQLLLQVEYDYYRRDLDPQMALFEPPSDVRIVETNP